MTSLTLVRQIAARPSIVFDALSTADGVSAWWGPDPLPVTFAEVDARVGGAFRVRFLTTDGLEHEASGEYLEVMPHSRLVMDWRWTANGEPGEAGRTSRIEIDLRPVEIGVELTFTHAQLKDAASAVNHEWGWNRSLIKLAHRVNSASPALV